MFGVGPGARYTIISTLVTSASSHNLTDLATVKSELNLSSTADDAVLSRYIAETSATIENFCNRVFVVETVRDVFYPPRDAPMQVLTGGVDPLTLSRWPVRTLSSVTENGDALTVDTDFILDVAVGALTRLDGNSYPTIWGSWPIVAQYDAGYSTIPADVAGACIDFVKWRYFSRFRDPGLKSQEIAGDYSASYLWGTGPGGPGDIPITVADKVERYRVPVIG